MKLWRPEIGVFLSTAALLLWALPAPAQQRPSLSDLESRLQSLEDAVCPQLADPRPLTCPASCRCSLGTPYPTSSNCSETAPGTFEVVSQEPYDSSCRGYCGGGSGGACDPQGPNSCPAGESCFQVGPFGVCLLPPGSFCFSAADCSAPYTSCEFTDPTTAATIGICTANTFGCVSAADCPVGYSCASPPGACEGPTACGTGGTCDSGTLPPATEFLIENVGTAGSATLAACDGLPTQYNSNDAQACVADVEAALGAACTTLP